MNEILMVSEWLLIVVFLICYGLFIGISTFVTLEYFPKHVIKFVPTENQNPVKLMRVHFKNGTIKEVPSEIVQILTDKLEKGCGTYQCFSEEDKVFLILNIDEIVFID